jgi:DNA ligase (NAD+)
LLFNIADLYKLNKEQILPLERMAEKSVNNLLEGIENSKIKPFSKVLFGLGIRYVGETVAKRLAKAFGSIKALRAASLDSLTKTDEIGERIAESIITYFSKSENIEIIETLSSFGLQLEQVSKIKSSLSAIEGKKIVVSGVFENYSREKIKDEIENLGGVIMSSVSSKTDYLIAGSGIGPSKKAKAKNLNIPILTEREYDLLKEKRI